MKAESASSRVALIAGGSGGIGAEIALRLAADGMDIAVQFAGRAAAAQSVVDGAQAQGGHGIIVQGDIADERAMAHVADEVEAAFGGIDVIVNAAGIMLLGPIAEFDLAALDRMHRTNIRGAFVISQLAANRLRSGGALVNLSSTQTRAQYPGYGAYIASKAAVEGLTMVLARELRGRDITVNAVAPGPVATPLFLEGKDQATIDKFASLSPLERLGTPRDAADAVAFLAGPGRWVNGQVIFVNGGLA
jgi:3-oxoacyl-[acyl-carrier protein] reductase